MNQSNLKFHKDMLAFTCYICNTKNFDETQKLSILVSTICHDMNILIKKEKRPTLWCAGYSRLDQQ